MKNRPNSRRLASIAACIVFSILVAACGGTDADTTDAAAETTTTAAETPTTEADADTTTEAEPVEADSADDTAAPTTTVEARTDEEVALGQLDLMLVQLGIQQNLVETADCVVERLESEGIELVGQGTPELIALLGCEPSVGQSLFSASGLPFEAQQSVCVVDGITAWLAGLPLLEAEALFGDTPPEDLLVDLSGECGVPVDELRAGIS